MRKTRRKRERRKEEEEEGEERRASFKAPGLPEPGTANSIGE